MDLQDPVPGRFLPPAVSGHELPVLKALHGVVKQPRGDHKSTTLFPTREKPHGSTTVVETCRPVIFKPGPGEPQGCAGSSYSGPVPTHLVKLFNGLMIRRNKCVSAGMEQKPAHPVSLQEAGLKSTALVSLDFPCAAKAVYGLNRQQLKGGLQ